MTSIEITGKTTTTFTTQLGSKPAQDDFVALMPQGRVHATENGCSATVQAIVEDTITWTEDKDFGYEIATAVPGVDDAEIIQPRRLYERQGRLGEYDAMVARLKRERKEYLASFAGLDEDIVKSIG